jgi:hypothetical protein
MEIVKEFTVRELRELVEKASRDNPHLTSRLEKAAFLVLLRRIETLGDSHYQVMSEDALRYYNIVDGHCECTDYVRHGTGHPCKHRLAVSLIEKLDHAKTPYNPDRLLLVDAF